LRPRRHPKVSPKNQISYINLHIKTTDGKQQQSGMEMRGTGYWVLYKEGGEGRSR